MGVKSNLRLNVNKTHHRIMKRYGKTKTKKETKFGDKKGRSDTSGVNAKNSCLTRRGSDNNYRGATTTEGSKIVIVRHRHEGVFIARGKEDALVTRNITPGESVY